MTSSKPSPPQPTPYHPLPSTPPPPQNDVISPPHHAFHHSFRCYLYYIITFCLFAVAIYILYPSNPTLTVTDLLLNRLKVNTDPISIDIELGVTIHVRNPDVYSLNYESVNVSVEYRGEQLGFATSDGGNVKALGTSDIEATVVVNGAEVVAEAVDLVKDLVKGLVTVTTSSEIRGTVGILVASIPITAKISCELVLNTSNQTIEQQDCYPA